MQHRLLVPGFREAAGGPQRLFSNREGYGEQERDRGDRPNVTLRVTFGAVPAVTFPQGVWGAGIYRPWR